MSDVIIVAIISGACSLAGSLFGVISLHNLTTYRLKKLEEKVDKHNNLVERMYKVEADVRVLQEA